ncbi:MAG: hypothetical protein AAFU54_22325 [Chloroflexota bacterium]
MTDRMITLKQMRNTIFVLALVIPAVLLLSSLFSPMPMADLSLAIVVFIGMAVLSLVMAFIVFEVERERDLDL